MLRLLVFDHTSSKCGDLRDLGLADLPPNLGIGFINGVFTDFDGAKENAEYISKLAGDYNIQFVYNATHGHHDLIECQLGLDFIATTPVGELHNMWDRFFDKSSPEAKFLQICHSQGTIHVRNGLLCYAPERRERILVVAIAPGAYLYEETCAKTRHYRASGWRDPIPRIDFFEAQRVSQTVVDLSHTPMLPGLTTHFKVLRL